MNNFLKSIKFDYLQRTRSYRFLITLCFSLVIAYTFIPSPEANYSTIRIGNYQGDYNSAWIGYVTAMMTSVFLSLIGFYLINSGIKKDLESKIGEIIATTRIKNFGYLMAKMLSNFLTLSTIVLIIFIMSILLFFLFNTGYSFEIIHFLKPYFLITLPAIFFVSALAVVFEVIFTRKSILQNIVFFAIFSIPMTFTPQNDSQFTLDLFGTKIVMHQMEEKVKTLTTNHNSTALTVGYVLGTVKQVKKFRFEGIKFSNLFITSRLLWGLLGIVLVFIVTPVFHRFNIKKQVSLKKTKPILFAETNVTKNEVNLTKLPRIQNSYGIFSFLKTEFIMLIRQGPKWLWILNFIGITALFLTPITVAHQFILPILWFLQIGRLSELINKERTNNVQPFVFASYQPIKRLLTTQLLTGTLLLVMVSFPLIFRYVFQFEYIKIASICIGAIFIVLLATSLGFLSKGKKLFEILFFFITYANMNLVPATDYFGGLTSNYIYTIGFISLLLLILSYGIRNYEIRKS